MALTKKTKQVPKKKFGTKKKTLKRYNKTQKGGAHRSGGVKERKEPKATKPAGNAGNAAQRAAEKAAGNAAGKPKSRTFFLKNVTTGASNTGKNLWSTKSSIFSSLFGQKTKPLKQKQAPVMQKQRNILTFMNSYEKAKAAQSEAIRFGSQTETNIQEKLGQQLGTTKEVSSLMTPSPKLQLEREAEALKREKFFSDLKAQEDTYRSARLEEFRTRYGENALREKLNLGPEKKLDPSHLGELSALSSTLKLEQRLGSSSAPLSVVYNLLTNPEKTKMDELLKSSTNPNDVAEALKNKIETVARKIGGETSARINTLPLELQIKVLQKYYETAEDNKTSARFRDILAEARAQVPQISYESRANEGQQFLEAVQKKLKGSRFS
jgi:hypothetical protein